MHDNIEILNKVVEDAKTRKANGVAGPSIWKEDLQPRAAVCARTIPLLEVEAKRLRETLASVSMLYYIGIQLLIKTQCEAENLDLQMQLEKSTKATEKMDARTVALLDKLDAVRLLVFYLENLFLIYFRFTIHG